MEPTPVYDTIPSYKQLPLHIGSIRVADDWIRDADLKVSEATALPPEPQPLPNAVIDFGLEHEVYDRSCPVYPLSVSCLCNQL